MELGYNPIGPDGAKALAEVLKFHGNVKDLNLGWCQVRNGMGYSETFVRPTSLSLYKQNLLQIGASGVEYIADTLKYNSTIQSLDLRANGLRDEVVPFYCSLYCGALEHIDSLVLCSMLVFNYELLQGAICLARSLKVVNEALTSLNLGFNEIRVWDSFFRRLHCKKV